MEKYIRESDAVQTVIEKPDMTPDEKAGIIRRLKAIPAADVVEVVRCRDCEYRDYDDEPYSKKVAVCTGAMAYSNTPDDWYCPMGKRKAGGKDDGD